jgi:DNA-binding response OmpR family regulator
VQQPPDAAPRAPTGDLLIVENDARIVELLQWFLRRRGHQVRAVATFAEARQRIAERRPDLLLSDVELGTENARTLLPDLARDGLLPPTLVVSGFVDHELSLELLAIPGVQAVIQKPFEFERLERWIDDFFHRAAQPAQ